MNQKTKSKNNTQKQEYKKVKDSLPKINRLKSALLFITFSLTAIGQVAEIFLTTFVFQSLIDQDFKAFIMWFSITLGAIPILIIKKIADYILDKECEILKTKMRKYIFRSYSNEAGQRKISKEPGKFKSITIDNVNEYVDNYIKKKYTFVFNILLVITAIGFIFYISWIIGLISIALTLLSVILGSIVSAPVSAAQNKYFGQLNKFNNDISNSLDAHSVFYLNNSTNKITQILQKRFSWIENSYMSFYIKATLYQIPSLLMAITIQIGILAIAGAFVIKGYIVISALASIGFLSGMFSNSIFSLLEDVQHMVANTKMFYNFVPTIEKHKSHKNISQLNSITVHNYNVIFDDEKLFENEFNYQFIKGNKYVIVGDSGSGKSTFINSIFGNQNNYEGNIKINDENVKNVSIKSFTNNVGLLNSTPHIFKATLLENITVFDESVKPQKVQELLNAIKFHELELNKEIDIKSISEGQKQKINLLRVMLKEPQWIISDEGFSNIDDVSRKNIMKYISKEYKGGLISITHHLSAKEEVIYDSKITF